MNRSALTVLTLVAGILFTVGFACNFGTNKDTAADKETASKEKPSPEATKAKKKIPTDISGDYAATGTNVNGGGPYKADLSITQHDDVYQFSWSSGGRSYDGVGVKTDDAVAVSYTDGPNGKGCGVVLYSIGSDGSLDGVSGYWGVNTTESETATRVSGSDLDGKYDVEGKNPEGDTYKGSLTIKKDGEGYTFNWNAGNSFTGFGIKTGDKVAVGFGGKQCAFVSYQLDSDGTLDGKWGGPGTRSFGTEIAKKK